MKSKEDIYLEEVNIASKVDERLGRVLFNDTIRKFVLNCLTKQKEEFIKAIDISDEQIKKEFPIRDENDLENSNCQDGAMWLKNEIRMKIY